MRVVADQLGIDPDHLHDFRRWATANNSTIGKNDFPHDLVVEATRSNVLFAEYFRGPLYSSCAVETARGDFIQIGLEAGAELGHMRNGWLYEDLLEKAAPDRVCMEGGINVPSGDSMIYVDATGKRAIAYVGDISLPATGEAAVKAALDRIGRLDVLFNNAGIFGPKPFLDVTEDEYDRFLNIILKGKFFIAQAAAKAMKATGRGGAIVQTGSMWALQAIGATPSSAYSAANGGVHALVKNLAIELAPDKIRVNAIAPGVIETPVFSTFLTPEQVKTVLPTFNAMHPLGRNGQPADAAEALLFLASDQASFITGVILPVDGGIMAGRQ